VTLLRFGGHSERPNPKDEMHINSLSEAAMTGSLDRRRAAPLPAALALGAVVLTLTVLSAAAVSNAAGTPPGWYAGKSTIQGLRHPAAPTWPAHPRPIRPATAAVAPTWPAHPQAIQPATSATAPAREGFDWGSAAIGAGVGALLAVVCGATVLVPTTRRARRARAA
jgi:hypothetical protein